MKFKYFAISILRIHFAPKSDKHKNVEKIRNGSEKYVLVKKGGSENRQLNWRPTCGEFALPRTLCADLDTGECISVSSL